MALRFDAGTDMLSRTTNLPTVTSWTIMAWAYLSVDRNAYTSFFTFGTSSNYFMGTTSDGTTLILANPTSEVSGSSLTVGTWVHVAASVAGTGAGQYLGYLNGVLNITHAGASAVTAGTLWFGNDNVSEFLNGRLAAAKVYSGAVLTVDEIAAEMRYYTPLRWANLNAWYPCLEPVVADNAKDFGGSAFDMTVGGTLAVEDGPPIPWAPASDDWGHMAYDDVAPSVWVPRPVVVSQAVERAAIF